MRIKGQKSMKVKKARNKKRKEIGIKGDFMREVNLPEQIALDTHFIIE